MGFILCNLIATLAWMHRFNYNNKECKDRDLTMPWRSNSRDNYWKKNKKKI